MRTTLHSKITIVFSSILTVILLCVYLYLSRTLRSDTYQRIEDRVKRELALVRSYLEEDSINRIKGYDLDKVADRIGSQLGLRVTIISPEGVVLGDSELDGDRLFNIENHLNRPEVQQALNSGIGFSRRYSTTLRKNLLYVASVYGNKKNGGIIRLAIPLSDIDLISKRLRHALAFSLVVAFAVAVGLGLIVMWMISMPIRQISSAAKEISRGDFSRRISVPTNDELKELSEAFNYMSAQIENKINELNLSRLRIEAVFSSMAEGVMVVGSNGRAVLVNRSLREAFSIDGDVSGKMPIEVVRIADVQDAVDKALNSGQESRFEVSIGQGLSRIFSVYARPFFMHDRVEGVVVVFHDITDARRFDDMRREFVANVSHELRTPLANIKGYTETLLDGAINDRENAGHFLKVIHSESERLAKLIEDILDLSRIESGSMEINLVEADLKELIGKAVSMLGAKAVQKSVTIKVCLPDNLLPVCVDQEMILQVLLNLIDNAIKYNRQGGEVVISAEKVGNFVRVSVYDTGIGIPKKDLPRLFERFYRVDKARSRQLGGTGLGLAIVKHIVYLHNGEVFVDSELDKGSVFSFTLPIVDG